ncbi:MAG: hypothetical protein OEY49_05245 [Candidatus Heimdallarchaeota archaeon]|nr:hypothetical protein [Candidatus Heimdallarchaeota archaeon]
MNKHKPTKKPHFPKDNRFQNKNLFFETNLSNEIKLKRMGMSGLVKRVY